MYTEQTAFLLVVHLVSSVCHCYDMLVSEVISVFFGKAICHNTAVICWLQISYCQDITHSCSWFCKLQSKQQFTSRRLFSMLQFLFLKVYWPLEVGQSAVACVWSARSIWGGWMFLGERGQVLLLSLEPISGKARGHHYISSAVRHNSYSKTAATSIWRFYSRATFEHILN